MNKLTKALSGAFFLACLPAAANAQRVLAVTECGSPSPFFAPTPGKLADLFVDVNGNLCVGGSGGGGGGGAISGPLGSATLPAAAVSVVLPATSTLPPFATPPAVTISGVATAANQTATHSAPGTSATSAETIQGSASGVPIPTIPAPTTSATAAIVPSVSGSAVAGFVLKATAGNLYNAYATCTADCWLMIFNAVAAPADGATTAGNASGNLVECVPILSGARGEVNYSSSPERFSVGITAVISSTACATKTAAATGFIHGLAQ